MEILYGSMFFGFFWGSVVPSTILGIRFPLSAMLKNPTAKFRVRWDSNSGLLGEKRECIKCKSLIATLCLNNAPANIEPQFPWLWHSDHFELLKNHQRQSSGSRQKQKKFPAFSTTSSVHRLWDDVTLVREERTFFWCLILSLRRAFPGDFFANLSLKQEEERVFLQPQSSVVRVPVVVSLTLA